MNKALVLKFKNLEIDFAKLKNGELLEKIFKSKPVSYLPTLLYTELFNIAYDNLINKQDDSFSLLISYEELRGKLDRQVCTLSNALRSLAEAKLITRNRIMIDNNQPNARFKTKPMLNITIKISSTMQRTLKNILE